MQVGGAAKADCCKSELGTDEIALAGDSTSSKEDLGLIRQWLRAGADLGFWVTDVNIKLSTYDNDLQ